uniref:Uncharacterized protein n=1 Tax=Cannabis sativa TaxID=3483 RepID=A0A803PVF9_CANSA
MQKVLSAILKSKTQASHILYKSHQQEHGIPSVHGDVENSMSSTDSTPKDESGEGLSRDKNARGCSKQRESIHWHKTAMRETSCNIMKRLQPMNLVVGGTAPTTPFQEQGRKKVSPLNHSGRSHHEEMRGVILTSSMRTARKT